MGEVERYPGGQSNMMLGFHPVECLSEDSGVAVCQLDELGENSICHYCGCRGC